MGLVGLLLLALVVLGGLLTPTALRRWRRAGTLAQPFPARWRRALRRHVPYVAQLPAQRQLQLKRLMQVFLAEVPFIGCQGLQVSETMRVVVAAQACLLLLGRGRAGFEGLRQVLLYPGPFVVQRSERGDAGVLHEQRQVLAGESWSQGQVILSWPDCLDGAADPHDGRNVVIHEFAHQLDQETGAANGAPPQPLGDDPTRWAKVFQAAYTRLRRQTDAGVQGLISPYGATSPAEFFAVVSEVFFEQPQALARQEPAVYAELQAYYGVDPLAWC